MNKLFSKIAALSVGLAMAIGVGVAVGSRSVKVVRAAEDDTHEISDFTGKGESTVINNGATPKAISITDPGYSVKQVIIGWTHNKSNDGITASVSIGGDSLGSGKVGGQNASTTTTIGSGSTSLSGDIEVTWANGMSGTKKGTLTINSITLVEGSSGPADVLESISVTSSMSKTEYTTAESWSAAGLTATGTYETAGQVDITNKVTWSFDPATPAVSVTSVVATATLGTVSGSSSAQAVTVTEAPADPGTEGNPYTVAQAIAAINDAGSATLSDKYVSGIICQIDSYNSNYKSITYWISDDGKTTTKLQVYSGKGLNGADFSSTDDLSLKYSVVVNGNLKKYNSTYEFDKTSKIISYNAPQIVSVDSVESAPSQIYVGQTLNPEEVTLNVTKQGGSSDTVPATSIDLNTSVAGTGVQGKAYYNSVGYATFSIDVIEKEFSGSHVLSLKSDKTTYKDIISNDLFHEYVDNSEAFTLSGANNFRFNGSGHTGEFMFFHTATVQLTAPSGYVISTVVVNGYAGDSTDTTFSVGGIEKTVSSVATPVDYSYTVLGNSVVLSNLTGTSRLFAASITITLEKYVAASLASEFEATLISMTDAECSAKAVTSENWSNISTIFGHIENDFGDAATLVKNATTEVEAIARYKNIVEKYGYEDFLDKGYVKLTALSFDFVSQGNPTILIVIAIATASTLAFTLLLVFKKRKHN